MTHVLQIMTSFIIPNYEQGPSVRYVIRNHFFMLRFKNICLDIYH